MKNKIRISVTLNQKQLLDAQILAACDAVGGDIGALLKLFALRGIMADPAMSAIIAKGAAKAAEAQKSVGTGFNPKKIPAKKTDITSTSELVSFEESVGSEFVQEAPLVSVTAPYPTKADISQVTIDSAPYVSPATGSPVDDYEYFIFNEPKLS